MGDFLAGVPPQVQAESRKFVAKLRRRQLQSSEAVARKTLEIMRLIVATAVVSDVQALITMIKQVAAVLVAAQRKAEALADLDAQGSARAILWSAKTRSPDKASDAALQAAATARCPPTRDFGKLRQLAERDLDILPADAPAEASLTAEGRVRSELATALAAEIADAGGSVTA